MNTLDMERRTVQPGFGVAALNRAFGNVVDGKRYVYQAPSGRDQHLLVLQLIRGAVVDGQTVLLLTDEDPDVLVLQGVAVGVDITQALSIGRLVIVRFSDDFRELATVPSRAAGLMAAWTEQLHQIRPHRVVFMGWPRVLDQDVKLLGTLEQLERIAIDEARASTLHVIDPDDPDRYGRDVRRRAFGEVKFTPRSAGLRAEITRGPVALEHIHFDLSVQNEAGFVELAPTRPADNTSQARERLVTRN
ncbi:MAG: hypothetical protein ACI9MC_002077 [Kiritimatiellia bacterium]|jgi:hypothetical protein